MATIVIMFDKLKEKLKGFAIKIITKIKKKRTSMRLAKYNPELICSVCKKTITRDEFIAIMGPNRLVPALYSGALSSSYGWLKGSKRYCRKCFDKEFRK